MITDDKKQDSVPQWKGDERWKGIERPYTAEDVVRLRGSIQIEYTLANHGSRRLWELLQCRAVYFGPGCFDRQPGRTAGASRVENNICERMAGCR